MSNLDAKLAAWRESTDAVEPPEGLAHRILLNAAPLEPESTTRSPAPTAPRAARGPANRGPHLRRTLLALCGALLAVAAGLGALRVATANRAARDRAQVIAAQAEARRAEAEAAFREGKDLVKQGRFAEAVPRFRAAQEAGADDSDLADYLDRATREASNEALLDQATVALSSGQLAAASRSLAQIPPESLLADSGGPVEAMRLKIRAAIPLRLAEARAKMASHDDASAEAILADLTTLDPTNAEALASERSLAILENRPAPLHINQVVHAVDHRPEVIDAFDRRNLNEVRDLVAQYGESDDVVRRLGQKIAEFEKAYDRKDIDPAAFSTALSLDKEISGGRSDYTPGLTSRAIAELLRDGATARSAGYFLKAYKAFKGVADLDPRNKEAATALEQLREKARDLYMQAYQESSDDRAGAIAAYRQVMAMTPPGDEFHFKAQQRLMELGN